MAAYLEDNKRCGTPSLTATHATVTRLTTWTENVGQKLYMNIISFPVLFDDLHTTAINCCGNVWTNGKETPKSLVQTMGLKPVMKILL
jgi:hypothetical protein